MNTMPTSDARMPTAVRALSDVPRASMMKYTARSTHSTPIMAASTKMPEVGWFSASRMRSTWLRCATDMQPPTATSTKATIVSILPGAASFFSR